jgi:hypothetical protein
VMHTKETSNRNMVLHTRKILREMESLILTIC